VQMQKDGLRHRKIRDGLGEVLSRDASDIQEMADWS